MAQFHEHQSKKILEHHGVLIPSGGLATTPLEAGRIAQQLKKPVVIKAQIFGTSRAASGGIKFAETLDQVFLAAQEILSNLNIKSVLVEEKFDIKHEFYLGFIIDNELKRPILMFNAIGGSGIEERAAGIKILVCSIRSEPTVSEIEVLVQNSTFDLSETLRKGIATILQKLYQAALGCEARIAEINPLALTTDGLLVALDARLSIDDYAAFRHQDLGIEIARELGHEPTKLESIAWEIEKDDFRGTFYFVEILDAQQSKANNNSLSDNYLIGFHGAGGGGSMASLDAAQRNGLQPACYVDTSGNPPASKVYRAARIILSIPNIKGYFLSGSGVASQEQFVLARAVIKAFLEVNPSIPAVLRLGGNGEEIAKILIEQYSRYLPAPFEAYQKMHSADFCAARLQELIHKPKAKVQHSLINDKLWMTESKQIYSFKTRTGRVFYDHAALENHDTTGIIESCPTQILSKNERGLPILNISEDEAEKRKCVECLACEFAAWEIAGVGNGAFIDFPITDL